MILLLVLVPLNQANCQWLFDAWWQFGLLETTWNHLVQADRSLPLPLIKERFCMMLEKDDYPAALSCLINHTPSELQGFSRISWLKQFKHNAHRIRSGSLEGLMHDAAIHLASGDSPSAGLQTLVVSCKEFLKMKWWKKKCFIVHNDWYMQCDSLEVNSNLNFEGGHSQW